MGNVRVNIKNLDSVLRNTRATFKKVAQDKQMYNEIGVYVTKTVQAKVRTGKPLNNTGAFPALKDTTKKIREKLAKINETHPNFKPSKSNLTFTGQLVNAIGFKFTGRGFITLLVKDSVRRPYYGEYGKTPPLNSELDKDLRKMGFYMFTARGIDRDKQINKRIKAIALKYLRKALRVQK